MKTKITSNYTGHFIRKVHNNQTIEQDTSSYKLLFDDIADVPIFTLFSIVLTSKDDKYLFLSYLLCSALLFLLLRISSFQRTYSALEHDRISRKEIKQQLKQIMIVFRFCCSISPTFLLFAIPLLLCFLSRSIIWIIFVRSAKTE